MKAKIKVFRYNPKKDKEGYYKTYEVKEEKGKTILDCLNEIKWAIDGTLSYRRSCRSAICGSCAVKINNKAKLACKTQVSDELKAHDEIVIEPLDNMAVIRDLVVDKDVLWKKIEDVMPFLITKTEHLEETSMTKRDVEAFKESENCILCGCCYSDCDVVKHNDEFLGPAALVKGFRFVIDPRDIKAKERLKIYSKKGLWSCAHSFKCIEQCPKKIQPGFRIGDLREIAINSSVKYNVGAINALFYKKSIKEKGKLDEARYILKVKGLFGLIGMSGLTIKLLLKGRIPPLFIKKVKGIEQIQNIYKELEEKN